MRLQFRSMNIITQYSIEDLKRELIEPLQKDLKRIEANKDPEILLSRKEAAKFLGITLVTLHDWTKRKFVISGRIGNRVYFKKSNLINAIENQN